MTNPYREAGYLTAEEARQRTMANHEKKLQTQFLEIIHQIEEACGKGEYFLLLYERMPGSIKCQLQNLGYRLENCYDGWTVTKVSW